jgi:hypothetical protein
VDYRIDTIIHHHFRPMLEKNIATDPLPS